MLSKFLYQFFIVLTLYGCDDSTSQDTQPSNIEYGYDFHFTDPTQDKNFFLLSMINRSDNLREVFRNNEVLNGLKDKNVLAFNAAKSTCEGDVNCIDQLLRLNQNDIEKVSVELMKLIKDLNFKKLLNNHLRASKLFVKYENLSDEEFIENSWIDAAKGINNILSVYGLGVNPRYPEIDKVSYDINSLEYKQLIMNLFSETNFVSDEFFFSPSLTYAMGLLKINNRDEAGRYEVLLHGENNTAFQNLSNVVWEDYDYSLIVVLGDSPNSANDLPNISIGGMVRSDYGIQQLQNNRAPLIVFSGGHVRPFQTQFSEAIEMKKYVMDNYDIPEAKILVDPHARHTTTNFRNVSRLIYRYRIPNIKVLVISSKNHIDYIVGQGFKNRCLDELGYIPIQFHDRINDIELEFTPFEMSLHSDSSDPLDP